MFTSNDGHFDHLVSTGETVKTVKPTDPDQGGHYLDWQQNNLLFGNDSDKITLFWL